MISYYVSFLVRGSRLLGSHQGAAPSRRCDSVLRAPRSWAVDGVEWGGTVIQSSDGVGTEGMRIFMTTLLGCPASSKILVYIYMIVYIYIYTVYLFIYRDVLVSSSLVIIPLFRSEANEIQ